MASNGENYLVVWGYGPAGQDICGQLISPDGTLIGSNFIISTILDWVCDPDIAFDGENYLVVWTNTVQHCKTYGGFVSQAGNVIDTNFCITSSSIPVPEQWNPRCEGGIEGYLVVWSEENDSTNERGIRGAFVPSLGIEDSKKLFPLNVSQNSPNPFYSNTKIQFNIIKGDNVIFRIQNLTGGLIEERNLGYKPPGFYMFSFCSDSFKEGLVQGVYFYSFRINNCIITKKMVVLR